MSTLADTRDLTLDDAIAILEQLALCDCRLAAETARAEKRVAAIKAECELRTEADRRLRADLESRLTVFILSHQKLFQKPRAVRTDFGEFGLRAVANRLEVTDEAAAIAFARENGYPDMLQEITTLVKDAAKKRIAAGELVPGCALPQGERPYYKVAKALLDEATEKAA